MGTYRKGEQEGPQGGWVGLSQPGRLSQGSGGKPLVPARDPNCSLRMDLGRDGSVGVLGLLCRNLVEICYVLLMKGHRELSRDTKQLVLLSGWHLQSVPKYRFSVLHTDSLSYQHSRNRNLKPFPNSLLVLTAWRDCPARAMLVYCIVWVEHPGKGWGFQDLSSSWSSLQVTQPGMASLPDVL